MQRGTGEVPEEEECRGPGPIPESWVKMRNWVVGHHENGPGSGVGRRFVEGDLRDAAETESSRHGRGRQGGWVTETSRGTTGSGLMTGEGPGAEGGGGRGG